MHTKLNMLQGLRLKETKMETEKKKTKGDGAQERERYQPYSGVGDGIRTGWYLHTFFPLLPPCVSQQVIFF